MASSPEKTASELSDVSPGWNRGGVIFKSVSSPGPPPAPAAGWWFCNSVREIDEGESGGVVVVVVVVIVVEATSTGGGISNSKGVLVFCPGDDEDSINKSKSSSETFLLTCSKLLGHLVCGESNVNLSWGQGCRLQVLCIIWEIGGESEMLSP